MTSTQKLRASASGRAAKSGPARTLVTGGAGFIGSHLCRRLLAEGEEVVCVDDLSTGRDANLVDLRRNKRFGFVRHDISEPLEDLGFRFDKIYNLACPASPVHYQADRIRTGLTAVLGTLNVLRLAARDGARFLQASTSEVYGDPEVHPQTEDYRGCVSMNGPRACYDEGKRFGETLACDFARQHGLQVRIARIFNTYGPAMQLDDGRVVSNFIVQALTGRALTIYGDGSQTRSFCFVDDTVEGLMRLMQADAVSGPVNIGNPDEITVERLGRLVLMLTGVESAPSFAPLPVDDPRRRRPDISRAMAEIGWRPTTPLVQGLRETIREFAERLGCAGPVAAPPAAAAPRAHALRTPEAPGAGVWI